MEIVDDDVENIVPWALVVVDMDVNDEDDDDVEDEDVVVVEYIDDWSTFVDNDLLIVHVDQEEYSVLNELISTFLRNIVDNHFRNLRPNYSLYVLNFEYNSQSFPIFQPFLIFDIELSIKSEEKKKQ